MDIGRESKLFIDEYFDYIKIAQKYMIKNFKIKYLKLLKNRGKGGAVREGMMLAKGKNDIIYLKLNSITDS